MAAGTLLLQGGTHLTRNSAPHGSTLLLAGTSRGSYALPAPLGTWIPSAFHCHPYRLPCPATDNDCVADEQPLLESQPCNYEQQPHLLGLTLMALSVGALDGDFPCAAASAPFFPLNQAEIAPTASYTLGRIPREPATPNVTDMRARQACGEKTRPSKHKAVRAVLASAPRATRATPPRASRAFAGLGPTARRALRARSASQLGGACHATTGFLHPALITHRSRHTHHTFWLTRLQVEQRLRPE